MTIGALVMLVVAIPTLFMARRFYSEVMARWLGDMVLEIWGVRYRVHGAPQPPERADGLCLEPHVDARRLPAHRARAAADALLPQRIPEEASADRHRRRFDPNLLDRAAGVPGEAARDLQARRPNSA